MNYSIFDPTGNITALVESFVEQDNLLPAADEIMRLHPEVEQVGFVRLPEAFDPPCDFILQMAGGEFCGNASMSAAALYLLRFPRKEREVTVRLRVSGAKEIVEVRLLQQQDGCFHASIDMPAAIDIMKREFQYNNITSPLPVVRMAGISHIIVEPESAFAVLKSDKEAAEHAVRRWCCELGADGLGLMFLERVKNSYSLTPLVYIPGSGTLFWENSCASGGSAVGMYFAQKGSAPVKINLVEPGGTQVVESDPVSGKTILSGDVRILWEKYI